MPGELFGGKSRLGTVVISRVGSRVNLERPDGGKLHVPSGETFVIPNGETARFTDVTVDGTLEGEFDVIEESNIEDRYGKVNDTDKVFLDIGQGTAYRIYPSMEERASEASTLGGRIDTESPRIAFPRDTIAEEDDRVGFPDGRKFVLDERVPMETHYEFRATLVTNE